MVGYSGNAFQRVSRENDALDTHYRVYACVALKHFLKIEHLTFHSSVFFVLAHSRALSLPDEKTSRLMNTTVLKSRSNVKE